MIVNKNMLKGLLWVLVSMFVGVNVFLLNVIVHEAGHYFAAEYYNLEPEIEYDFGNMTELSFGLEGKAVASTSFIDNGNESELMVIALVGLFMNLFLGLICLFLFLFVRNGMVKELGLIWVVVSFMSFIMNMLPLEGTDGNLIFGLIIG